MRPGGAAQSAISFPSSPHLNHPFFYLNLSRGDVFHHDSKFIRIHGNQRLSELGLSGDKDGLDFSSRSDAAIDGELNWFIKTESWIRIGRRIRRRKQAVYKGRLGKFTQSWWHRSLPYSLVDICYFLSFHGLNSELRAVLMLSVSLRRKFAFREGCFDFACFKVH